MLRNILIVLFVILAYLLFTPHVAALAQEPQGEQVMVKGLNDATYQAYSMAIVEKAQKALKDEGLYAGEVTGELDDATMKALGEFQKKNGIVVSGIPTPKTRSLLLEEKRSEAGAEPDK